MALPTLQSALRAVLAERCRATRPRRVVPVVASILFFCVGPLLPGGYARGQTAGRHLIVFAASSLTEAFEEIAAAFEAEHPGTVVELSFGGSSTLAMQIVQGAPADVFASADAAQMAVVTDAGEAAGAPAVFAGNVLVVITPTDSAVVSLDDLADPGVRLVLAGPEVPVGRYARLALAGWDAQFGAGYAERVLANLVSEEPNVRQVAAKVELGEADAAIVYATDAAVLRAVRALPLPDAPDTRAEYWVAALLGASDPALAAEFVAFVLAPQGQAVLASHGFTAP